MSSNYDVLIVGNGSIGSYIACDVIRKYPHFKVGVLGPLSRNDAASAAAGAMANVFAEMEHPHTTSSESTNQKYLQLGIQGSAGWVKFLESISRFDDVVTARDTLIFLKKNASDFEISNFEKMVSVAQEHSVYSDYPVKDFTDQLPSSLNSVAAVTKIKEEYALDSGQLLKVMDNFLIEQKVDLLFAKVFRIDSSSVVKVDTNSGIFTAQRVIVAAGANSANLLGDFPMIPMLQGVGSAYHFKTAKLTMPQIFSKYVIRTVNRGGAQCGFHIVPRKDGFYLGAGNYITSPSESSHRLETLRYLFQTLEEELIGKNFSYDLIGSIVKGHRPKSIDGLPIIGAFKDDNKIFVATGTNRAGLTWAPRISDEVIRWINNEEPDSLIDGWQPDRKLISFGTKAEAIDYFIASRTGAAIEHKIIPNNSAAIKSKKSELEKIGHDTLMQAQRRFNSDSFVPHPDHWAPILDTNFSCVV
jgi:glycine/D-amino acid oxidase-like deaminating enzyme